MNMATPPLQGSKTLYQWHQGDVQQHLRALVPQWREQLLAISSQDLDSNASFVNYVRHHRLVDPCTGEQVELVEKSIRKIAFIGSQEARFYRCHGMLSGSQYFHHPACLGVIETPWQSLIFTEFVRGRLPRMHAIAKHLARGIAEQETLSHRYLCDQPARKALLLWSMDFFRPWFLLRPRFNFARCLPELQRLAESDERFAGLPDQYAAFGPLLERLKSAARHSPRCISHMDYLRKNLFVDKRQLLLIDWSEVKVGRVGFDGGAYLGSLFRRKDMPAFRAARRTFLRAYRASLPSHFDIDEAIRNLKYVFLLTALFHCLRPETISEYQANQRMSVLREKYDYLLRYL